MFIYIEQAISGEISIPELLLRLWQLDCLFSQSLVMARGTEWTMATQGYTA
jgi:hypothetical protein